MGNEEKHGKMMRIDGKHRKMKKNEAKKDEKPLKNKENERTGWKGRKFMQN